MFFVLKEKAGFFFLAGNKNPATKYNKKEPETNMSFLVLLAE